MGDADDGVAPVSQHCTFRNANVDRLILTPTRSADKKIAKQTSPHSSKRFKLKRPGTWRRSVQRTNYLDEDIVPPPVVPIASTSSVVCPSKDEKTLNLSSFLP